MNWTDLAVIAIITGFGLYGLSNGFIFSMFRIASFFVSVFVSIKFYPTVAAMLKKTTMFDSIQGSIASTLIKQSPGVDEHAKQAAADQVIKSLKLPGFLKDIVEKQIPNPSEVFPVDRIVDTISSSLAGIVIDMLSLVLLYIAIRIGLVFLRFIFKGIAKLPVFRQIDKLGGFAFGAVEGLLSVYIIIAVLMLFNAASKFGAIFTAIDNSVLAKFFYQNNFIVNWMFK